MTTSAALAAARPKPARASGPLTFVELHERLENSFHIQTGLMFIPVIVAVGVIGAIYALHGDTWLILFTALAGALLGILTEPLAPTVTLWLHTRRDPRRVHAECLTDSGGIGRHARGLVRRLPANVREIVDTLAGDGFDGSVADLVATARSLTS